MGDNINDEITPPIIKKLIDDKKISVYESVYLIKIFNKFNIIGISLLLSILNKVNNKELNKIFFDKIEKFTIIDNNTKIINLNKNYIINKFKKNIKLTLNNDQIESSEKILNFLLNEKKNIFGLFGFAGTGKTTILVELLTFLVKIKYIYSVVFTAPTNKALNVIKTKIRLYLIEIYNKLSDDKLKNNSVEFEELINLLSAIGIKIEFMTIHKLLKFESDLTDDGDLIFVRNTGKNLISKFNVVIMDECSMIPVKMIDFIISDINKFNKHSIFQSNIKIIFSGDPAQLPPIFEDKSAVFIETEKDMSINKYISYLEADDTKPSNVIIKKYDDYIKKKYEDQYNALTSNILNMDNTTMKQVMRNRINSVVELCYQTRLYALGIINNPDYTNCINKEGVYFYESNDKDKVESKWFQKFIKKINNNKPSIIITWTNPQAKIYNEFSRKIIFKKKGVINKFEQGDILILLNPYDVSTTNSLSDKILHTSEQIKVVNTTLTNINIMPFLEEMSIDTKRALANSDVYSSYYASVAQEINKNIIKSVRIWKLNVCKIDNLVDIFEIWILDDSDIENIKTIKEESLLKIKNLKKKLCLKFPNKEPQINKYVISQIKNEWYSKFVKPFASVTYGYAITCHKSQGSDFNNVFVDANDISKNKKIKEMKQCLYTAVTRVSKNIYILF